MPKKEKVSPVPALYTGFIDYIDEPRLAELTARFRNLESALGSYKRALEAALQAHGWLNEREPTELARRQDWFNATCLRLEVEHLRLQAAYDAMEAAYDKVSIAARIHSYTKSLQDDLAVLNLRCAADLQREVRAAWYRRPEHFKCESYADDNRLRFPYYWRDRAGVGLKAQ